MTICFFLANKLIMCEGERYVGNAYAYNLENTCYNFLKIIAKQALKGGGDERYKDCRLVDSNLKMNFS